MLPYLNNSNISIYDLTILLCPIYIDKKIPCANFLMYLYVYPISIYDLAILLCPTYINKNFT